VPSRDVDVVVRWELPEERAELAALELWDHGATALEERAGPAGRVVLVASYPTPEAAVSVAARVGAGTEEVRRDWEDAWKAYAEPVAVGPSLLVAPAWRPVPVTDGRLVVEIDSGPCFGSGSHPSTRLIIELLAADPPLGATVLDVGTGSGILAVVAARLGAKSVTAVDVDPEAVAVTRANAARNGVAGLVHASATPVDDVDGPFDVALLNVTAGVHTELAASVVPAVRPGGRLYLAGLLPGQWEHVAGAYAGCKVTDLPGLDGWVGAVLERA
jgi:ribosomal protein L11 methyltransferase